MTRLSRIAALIAAATLALVPGASLAQSWPDGDIDLIIPSGPGGGFDVYGRVLARAMEETLDVNIIPQNVSGGGGMRGATVAYQADPDGQSFAVFNVPGIIQPIIKGDKVAYDIGQIDWLGAMAFNQYVIMVAADSPYSTVEDLRASGEIISFTGYGSSGIAANRILCAELELECQIITGYPSNNEALLGVVRGDANASVPPISTAAAFNTNGDLKAILLMTDSGSKAFPDTPNATDAGYPAVANLGLIRAFGLPPGVPAETRAAFQEVFDTALGAASVAAWVDKTGNAYDAMSAKDLSALIAAQTELLTKYKEVLSAK